MLPLCLYHNRDIAANPYLTRTLLLPLPNLINASVTSGEILHLQDALSAARDAVKAAVRHGQNNNNNR